jgi:hypothetical protein
MDSAQANLSLNMLSEPIRLRINACNHRAVEELLRVDINQSAGALDRRNSCSNYIVTPRVIALALN